MTSPASTHDDLLAAAVEEYFRARERGEPLDREAFLARHAAVAAKLASFLDGDALLEAAIPWTASMPVHDDRAGRTIGRYTLIEKLGEGGMGEVWIARQSEPVKRKVALKLIKKGMDSRSVLARFEQERQALALMDHPNIAKVFDGGLTDDGQPYFVMEFVKGTPITDYCDARKLPPPARLELFVSVCEAIQHAHQKGIIHRDVKPSNVLVALYDDRPVVKVIDFGVAKATGGALTEATIETGFGVVGTPEYMSPEQATLNNLDIDTRSDVYALGVLLYELLTGSPPFSRKELERKGLLEILRMVREEEPPRPSAKLSTAAALPTLSANRSTEPKKLTGLLRNELDWIVMKALEKDRARRYETANGFAADVRRYLYGEEVDAHPPSAAYRMRKFVRRNRVQVMAASLVFAALVTGVVGTTLGLLEARKQEGIAKAAAEEEKQAKIREGQRADGERKATLRAVDSLGGILDAYRAQHNSIAFGLDYTRWAVALTYLNDKSFAKAEPICRELLIEVEKHRSIVWEPFQVRSMLGEACLGQKKYAEAEPLLLTGYNGLKQHEKHIHERITPIPEAIDRLIDLYTETNNANEVAKWRAERAKYETPSEPWRPELVLPRLSR